MKLFDKYLLACTNQRIPMPDLWQRTLGLHLTENLQSHIDTEENTEEIIPTNTKSDIMGYRFQQDETIDRGYVNNQVRRLELNNQSKYLLQLYLEALKEHKGLDYTSYLSVGTSTFSFPYYTTTATVLRGHKYSLYGLTMKPVTIQLKSAATNEVYAQKVYGLLSYISPHIIDVDALLHGWAELQAKHLIENSEIKLLEIIKALHTNEKDYIVTEKDYIINDNDSKELKELKTIHTLKDNIDVFTAEFLEKIETLDEYLTLEVKSYSQVQIVTNAQLKFPISTTDLDKTKEEIARGTYEYDLGYRERYNHTEPKVNTSANIIMADQSVVSKFPAFYPSQAYLQLEYSNKLIPALLDIGIVHNSPQALKDLLPADLVGETIEQKIQIQESKASLFDVDKYIGSNFLW